MSFLLFCSDSSFPKIGSATRSTTPTLLVNICLNGPFLSLTNILQNPNLLPSYNPTACKIRALKSVDTGGGFFVSSGFVPNIASRGSSLSASREPSSTEDPLSLIFSQQSISSEVRSSFPRLPFGTRRRASSAAHQLFGFRSEIRSCAGLIFKRGLSPCPQINLLNAYMYRTSLQR
uniref:Secreted protein n=1 Tax=Steinernema glaseri TaxID=37863 RepID=A0A1I8ARC0_9BILA